MRKSAVFMRQLRSTAAVIEYGGHWFLVENSPLIDYAAIVSAASITRHVPRVLGNGSACAFRRAVNTANTMRSARIDLATQKTDVPSSIRYGVSLEPSQHPQHGAVGSCFMSKQTFPANARGLAIRVVVKRLRAFHARAGRLYWSELIE